jgi:hypothetical protein
MILSPTRPGAYAIESVHIALLFARIAEKKEKKK